MIDWIELFLALIVCVTVHEAAHAWVALKLGDPTAQVAGRVSLNPLRHLDPIGTLMLIIAHFGWGKPVPINEYNLAHPKRDTALIAVAGPMANLLSALVIELVLKYVSSIPSALFHFLQSVFSLSVLLFVFNLIPLAPLDGSKFLRLFIPRSLNEWYHRFLAQGPLYLILLVVLDRLMIETVSFGPLSLFLQYGYEVVVLLIFLAT